MVQERFYALLYRDYWSNRRRLGRNVQNDGVGWVNQNSFSTPDIDPREIIVEPKEDGSVSINDLNEKSMHVGLVNPSDYVIKLLPQNILVRKRGYGRAALLSQTPQEWYRYGALIDTSRASRDPLYIEPPFEVNLEPVNNIKSDLKRLSIWNPLIRYPIIYIFVWLFNKYIYTYIFEALIPWLKPIHIPTLTLYYLLLTIEFITRILEELGTDIVEAFISIQLYDGEKGGEKHYRFEGDIPNWLESKPYWVFRYLYLWRGEFKPKKGFPPLRFEPDWERIDVWIDAKKGNVEWIVTDYHWRELWYQPENDLNRILVWVTPNFHTIMPLTLVLSQDQSLKDLYDRDRQLYFTWCQHLKRITGAPELEGESDRPKWMKRIGLIKSYVTEEELTPKKKGLIGRLLPAQITKYFGIAQEPIIVTSSLAKLWWKYWRYPLGSNNAQYKHETSLESKPAITEHPPSN